VFMLVSVVPQQYHVGVIMGVDQVGPARAISGTAVIGEALIKLHA
jgi:hypothetical protein